MVQIVLTGDNLGLRHRDFNGIVKKALTEGEAALKPINSDDGELENFYKIDIACNRKNVEYVLEVLKSDDQLLVARALRRSAWLVTDPQYAHLINPQYLHEHLFPHMTASAICKLLLHIKLNLTDESRVDTFYNFYKSHNKDEMHLKWLPRCSVPLIEEEVKNVLRLDQHLLKRLCERSFSILEIYLKKEGFWRGDTLKNTVFLLNKYTEKYLDIIEPLDSYEKPRFNARQTRFLMKKCPNRIIEKFDKYNKIVQLETFAKYLSRTTDIKSFLMKQSENKLNEHWFRYENLKHFVRYIPKEGRFEFLKKVFIEKSHYETPEMCSIDSLARCPVAMKSSATATSSANIYLWYRYAPFETAFPDLKKLIRNESNPTERVAILGVLASCAGSNMQHCNALLQYYTEKHINEPFKFKIQFVNTIISKANTHRFGVKTWNLLNTLFCSLDVYIESDNNVSKCVYAIILYKILHYEEIPEILEKKFTFGTMKDEQKKLSEKEKDAVFGYLYNYSVQKFKSKSIRTVTEFEEAIQLLLANMKLLRDWKKDLNDFPWVKTEIKNLIQVKRENSWEIDLSCLFNLNKSWRKIMFEDSILLTQRESACINTLKHDAKLLENCKEAVEALARNDRLSLQRLLSKLRIYWPESLAAQWAVFYRSRLTDSTSHKSLVQGLCALLSRKLMIELIEKYTPTDSKIDWSENNDIELSLRRQLAKNMHLTRPLLPPAVVLLFAQGDYLQYALPSLQAVLYNLSKANSRDIVDKLLNAPVSIQKHGIRLAFSKLSSEEGKEIFTVTWNRTKNPTIRAVLFKQTFDLMCKEKQTSMVEEIWTLLKTFIDNLSQDEDKTIYDILAKVNDVPMAVRGKFFMASYKYLKSLPAKANCESLIVNVIYSAQEIMDILDDEFITSVLLELIEKEFANRMKNYSHVISSYLLCCDEKTQTQRFSKVFLRYLELSLASWDVAENDYYHFRDNIIDLLRQLGRDIQVYIFAKGMTFPIRLLSDIYNTIQSKMSFEKNYVTIVYCKLLTAYVNILKNQNEMISAVRNKEKSVSNYNPHSRNSVIWQDVYKAANLDFAKICVEYLEEDVSKYCSSICILFEEALQNVISDLDWGTSTNFGLYSKVLSLSSSPESYMLITRLLPEYYSNDEEKEKCKEIRKQILLNTSTEVQFHYYKKFKNL